MVNFPFNEHSGIRSKIPPKRSAIDVLFSLIENPELEKGYRELKNYYELAGMKPEADALAHLISRRFHPDERTDHLHSVQE
jgi:hypothetical protein